ncbi:VOC family protein [Ruegeria arenilitoris]|uniref:VOC family protein n=1 Tax=Ruegeria arenilitoris TaxID=1173585 RepID=UPI00147DF75D|nr:VOC family protein [Ruegeria arenilitoris]
MRIEQLDHVNIVTTRLPEMVAWYEEVLGLAPGARPDFPVPGAWLYADGQAVVHLVGHDGQPNVGSEVKLKLEHFAFNAKGMESFEQKLVDRKHAYEKTNVPGVGIIQFHLADPDGNHIHIDFSESD